MFSSSLRCGQYLCVVTFLLLSTYINKLYAKSPSPSPTKSPSPSPTANSHQIKIPWGFQWGEPESHVEKSLRDAKTNIVERKKIGDREVLVVSGFIQHLLQQALFYFKNDALNEIELQYGDKKWGSVHYRDFFDQTRSNIENRYGPGRILTDQKGQQKNENQVLETIIGYQWTQLSATLQLFLFTAEKGKDSFQIVSLHYRGF